MKTKKTLNRRDFIGLTLAGSLELLAQNTNLRTASQKKVRVRYNVTSTTKAAKRNVENLKNVVRIMKDLPESNYCSWIAQAKIHKDYCPHGKPIFLPWHRAYLFYFEEICRKLLKESGIRDYDDFALPYWDWSKSPQMPEIFWKDSLQNDIPPPTGWINGSFDHRRQNKLGDSADPGKVGMNKINQILKKRFEGIIFGPGTGQLESGPHAHIHAEFIRGNMEMPAAAALDPIFWLHHANIDRLWLKWMRMHMDATPSPNCQIDCITKNPPRISKWLLSPVGIFYDAGGNPTNPQVCSLLNTFDSDVFNGGYYYEDDSTPTVFEDCIIMEGNNLPGYWIKGYVGSDKTAKMNGSVRVKISNFTTIPETLSTALNAFLTKTVPSAALLLTIEVEKPTNPQFSVTVFINARKNPSKLSIDNPAYVATFTFFENIGEIHQHGNEDMNMKVESRKFTFDVTDTILKLSKSKLFTLEDATISIRPEAIAGKKYNKKDGIRLISFEFELVKTRD
jgi:hypothetical protein